VSDNIINLSDYKNSQTIYGDEEEICDLEDIIVIGWQRNDEGDRCLHISSSVDTPQSLWMIDLAQRIVESRPPEYRNENE
jgi:hypothetical protein